MQFGREPLSQTPSATTVEGERGWVCSDAPAHFQLAAERPRPETSVASAPGARWDDDGGSAAVDDVPDHWRRATVPPAEDLEKSTNDSHDGGSVTTSKQMTRGETTRTGTVRKLHELIAALDSRVPQVLRVGEVSIARAAADLRAEALKRIEELTSAPSR